MTDYLARPIGDGPWPGVVVVHDAMGLGDDMREQADWLAAAGYLAVIPDLYAGKRAVTCIKGTIAQVARQSGPAFDHIERARVALAASADCTGKVGVIGYCMGGGFALLLAGRPGWSAASANYGLVPDDLAEILEGGCPLIASYGGKDLGLKGAAAKIQAAADSAGIVADVKEYPNARHGFINRLTAASPAGPLLKVMGIGYDHAAASDAKRRILTFFQAHLR